MSQYGEINIICKTIMEGVIEGIFIFGQVEGFESPRFYFWDSKMNEMTGLIIDEINNPTIAESLFFDDYNKNKFTFIIESLIKGIPLDSVEIEIVHKDGSKRIHSVSTTVIDQNGSRKIVGIVRDITYINSLENKLQETDILKKRIEENEKIFEEAAIYDSLKTEFYANITHEIRTPLNVIMGALQLLNLKLSKLLNVENHKDIDKYTGMMKQNCYRVIRLVNNLIDVTKIEAGFMKTEIYNTEIVSLIKSISMSVAPYVEDKGILFKFNTSVKEKLVACDPDMIERILLNLISNSIKFTKPGGEISVLLEQKDSNIIFSVIDTGIGIPEDKQEAIFDRFIQAGKSINSEEKGSGIGLCLVRSLIEIQGGSIQVASQVGKGSSFTVALPDRILEKSYTYVAERNINLDRKIDRIKIEFSDIYM